MSAELLARVQCNALRRRITTVDTLIPYFTNGCAVGMSGFTATAYPKATSYALADYVEKNNLQGKLRFDLFAGASLGDDVEDRFASLQMTRSRWPYQSGKISQREINDGRIDMGDIHLSVFAQKLEFGFFGHRVDTGPCVGESSVAEPTIDVAVVEVSEILPNGGLICGASIGVTPEILDKARYVVLEVNTTQPSYRGFHDVVPDLIPPHRQPFSITRVSDRMGTEHIPCPIDKVVGVVESRHKDKHNPMAPASADCVLIADHITDFFANEVCRGRLPANLLPLQSGVGNIANAVVAGLARSKFTDLEIWTEVFQDGMLELLDSGKLTHASTAALAFSKEKHQVFLDNMAEYRKQLVIRPQQITNHPELIRRLGVIAMNTPVEVDMYAHVNSTLVNGTRMIHGLGGSGDYLRSGYISIVHCPSTRPTKSDPTGISCIVPKATHIDHTEHDIDVVCTEIGLADVRGLHPRQRARTIIEKCAHPSYRDQLLHYYEMAEHTCLKNHAGHEPQLLDKVFKMHLHLAEHGTMHMDSWD